MNDISVMILFTNSLQGRLSWQRVIKKACENCRGQARKKKIKRKIAISLITTIDVCRSLALSRLKTGKFTENPFFKGKCSSRENLTTVSDDHKTKNLKKEPIQLKKKF